MEEYNLLATCPQDTRNVLATELSNLGAYNIAEEYKGVRFTASKETLYRSHLQLSTASALLWIIKRRPIKNLAMLADQTSRIKWHQIFSNKKTFKVDVVLADRGAGTPKSNDVSASARKGIEDRFAKEGISPPVVSLKDPDIVVVVFYKQDKTEISIRTSGEALHKRGYRLSGHKAPLKETVAATVLRLANYTGTKDLFDPFCGSGTTGVSCALSSRKFIGIDKEKKYLHISKNRIDEVLQGNFKNIRSDKPVADHKKSYLWRDFDFKNWKMKDK